MTALKTLHTLLHGHDCLLMLQLLVCTLTQCRAQIHITLTDVVVLQTAAWHMGYLTQPCGQH